MSDDEYYDEYDDEYFWIEEPDPTVADDLATTAHYDPLFFDDPALEVEDFYSDWDDLSDDYYDEDSTAVRRQRVMAKWPNKVHLPAEEVDRLQKDEGKENRKAATFTTTIRTKFHPGTDLSSFRSVIWKSPGDEEEDVKLHEPGDGEKVALLKNWREVFRSAHPSTDRVRMRKKGALIGAEVADTNLRSPRTSRGRKRNGDNEVVSEVASEGQAVENGLDEDTFTIEKASSPVHVSRVVKSPSDLPVNSKMMEHEYPIEGHESYDDPMGAMPHSPQTTPSKRRTRTNGTTPKKSEKQQPATVSPAKGRKRKAPASDEQPEAEQRESAAPKSKRVASKKVGETAEAAPAVRRSTRARK